jgi:hypothetical protein
VRCSRKISSKSSNQGNDSASSNIPEKQVRAKVSPNHYLTPPHLPSYQNMPKKNGVTDKPEEVGRRLSQVKLDQYPHPQHFPQPQMELRKPWFLQNSHST